MRLVPQTTRTDAFFSPERASLPRIVALMTHAARVRPSDRVLEIGTGSGYQAAVLSPVTGTVLAVNHPARKHPELVNEDPYGGGWLFIVDPDIPKRNLKRLYFGQESYQWMEQENSKLLTMMGPEYQGLAASGGSAVRDIFGAIDTLRWE